MNLRYLERREDPRTATYIPISLLVDGREWETPAHLVDLSSCGAAVLTTSQHAPVIGEHLHVHFETPNGDGGAEKTRRIETGIVVNATTPDRGIRRVGIRFYARPDFGCGLMGPVDLLSDHKKISNSNPAVKGRWRTAKNFHHAKDMKPATAPAY